MLFKNLRKLEEIEESDDDFFFDEEEKDDYEREEIKATIAGLTDAVRTMKGLIINIMDKSDKDDHQEDTQAIVMATEIYRSHLKISWDERYTQEVIPTLHNFEKIQNHLKEINYSFVNLKISKFRYEILRNILVSKLVFLIQRILYKVY